MNHARQHALYALQDPAEELAAIVIRASGLGFCTSRVATALGISPQQLTAIQQRINFRHDDRRQPAARS